MLAIVIVVGIAYMLLMFLIANKAEKSIELSSWLRHPIFHTFALGVTCSSWSYFGSVGKMSVQGIEFIGLYLGFTIMFALAYPLMIKMFRISKRFNIVSIADFLSVRFGKSNRVGALISIVSVIGLIPYIALQIKAIVSSLEPIAKAQVDFTFISQMDTDITALVTTVVLALFCLLYGAIKLDAREKHPGLVLVVGIESIVKLVILIGLVIFSVYFLFDGWEDWSSKIKSLDGLSKLFVINDGQGYEYWITAIAISMLAIIVMPHQFYLNTVENSDEQNLRYNAWMFPLFLFVLSLVIIPIALTGLYVFGLEGRNPDMFVLELALQSDNPIWTILVWLGGFSAAMGLIVIETVALSIMVSNNLVVPVYLRIKRVNSRSSIFRSDSILLIRRLSIVLILVLSFLFYLAYANTTLLADMGMLSFTAVVNCAPLLFLSMQTKTINERGAFWGLLVGFSVWTYSALLPALLKSNGIADPFLVDGPWGIGFLRPEQFLGISVLSPSSNTVFCSLLMNIIVMVLVSNFTPAKASESYFSELFVYYQKYLETPFKSNWIATAPLTQLEMLLGSFVGVRHAKAEIRNFMVDNNVQSVTDGMAAHEVVVFVEQRLSSIIGANAARTLVKSVTLEESISQDEVFEIVEENQQVKAMNLRLEAQSEALMNATEALKLSNVELSEMDQKKNEFLYTVTHELKTPLTSIIALSEILMDNPDLPEEQKAMYLGTVISESNRLSNLINEVLKLEKFEAGQETITRTSVDFAALLENVLKSFTGILHESSINVDCQVSTKPLIVSADEGMMVQVMVNLIGNAVKYARSRINIHAFVSGSDFHVLVSDDGKGIPIDQKDMIFDKFFQAKNQDLRKPEGTGLGLAICKKVINLHEGLIWVDTSFNFGAHLRFRIPL